MMKWFLVKKSSVTIAIVFFSISQPLTSGKANHRQFVGSEPQHQCVNVSMCQWLQEVAITGGMYTCRTLCHRSWMMMNETEWEQMTMSDNDMFSIRLSQQFYYMYLYVTFELIWTEAWPLWSFWLRWCTFASVCLAPRGGPLAQMGVQELSWMVNNLQFCHGWRIPSWSFKRQKVQETWVSRCQESIVRIVGSGHSFVAWVVGPG